MGFAIYIVTLLLGTFIGFLSALFMVRQWRKIEKKKIEDAKFAHAVRGSLTSKHFDLEHNPWLKVIFSHDDTLRGVFFARVKDAEGYGYFRISDGKMADGNMGPEDQRDILKWWEQKRDWIAREVRAVGSKTE